MSNIIVRAKQSDGSYAPMYPNNDAYHVKTATPIISYMHGNSVLENVQSTANNYLVPQYNQWFQNVDGVVLNTDSRLCTRDNFMCVVTPILSEENDYNVYCTITHNGGVSWGQTVFTPSTDNYIVSIIGVECSRTQNFNYMITLVGRRYITDTTIFTYQLFVRHNEYNIYQSKEYNTLNAG